MMILDQFGKIGVDFVLAAVVSAGFAVLFSVPRRLLLACALLGGFGYGARALLMRVNHMPLEWATLIVSLVIGFLALVLARRLRAPAPIFAIAACIPLVPGILAFTAMINFLRASTQATADGAQAYLSIALLNFLKTTLVLSSIGIGVAAPSLLFVRRKPIQD
ncbi:MAG: threonine/serine exporter family protein [Anaerolineae bacterium]|nr:threonine/serine exporter family protein [Anaerolineae bacterium]